MHADDVDGSYGRIEGDLLFAGTVGATLGEGGAGFDTHLALLYLSTAGLYGRYVEGFGNEDAAFDRMAAFGIEIRPLFLGRYALNMQKGPAHLDLFLDSFAFILGATFVDPIASDLEPWPGIEFGLSIEVSLVPSGSGPYVGLLGLLRATDEDLARRRDANLLEQGSQLVFTLSWHQVFDAGLVDLRDP